MKILLGLILPTLIVFAPLAILLRIGRRKEGVNRIKFGVAFLVCFLLGLLVPVVATYLSVLGLQYNLSPDDPHCFTGVGTFLYFGYMINLTCIPIAGLVLFPSKQVDIMNANDRR